jgi:MSHA biogenesis protein MshO
MKQEKGFTLLELVIVIVISGILAGLGAKILGTAFKSYFSLSNRTLILDNSDTIIRRMTIDIQNALPNSVRIACAGRCLELLHVRDSGRYRSKATAAENILDFTVADTSFEIIGLLNKATPGSASNIQTSNNSNACQRNNADCLVIFNTAAGLQNAYQNRNSATVRNISPAINPTSLTFTNNNLPANRFPAPSPKQRFYIVDTPITYLCDVNNRVLRRYDGYAITSNQNQVDSHNELINLAANRAEFHLMSDTIQNCQFKYSPGGTTHGGIVSIEITLNKEGETFSLFSQAQVKASP